MKSDTELIKKIQKLRLAGETYENIGEKCGVSGALIWKVARGMCTSHKARHYFGLPPKMVEVVPCRGCGEVHTTKTCTATYKAGSRKRWARDIPKDFDQEQESYFRENMDLHYQWLVEHIRRSVK